MEPISSTTPNRAPDTIQECLAPLAGAAMLAGIHIYNLALKQGNLALAAEAMPLCESVVKRCAEIVHGKGAQ